MKKVTLSLALCLAAASHCYSSQPNLQGFTYGDLDAPTGKEWNKTPDHLAHNKEQPRSTFYNFENVEQARKVLPENSKYWQSLDGTWKFNWVGNPSERPKGFFNPSFDVSGWDNIPVPSNWNLMGLNKKNGKQKYGTPIYCNQPYIFQTSVKVDDWRGGVMRDPRKDESVFTNRNEVGSYRRDFEIPSSWDGREVFVQFDGVDSFFYLYINGKYIGFSNNSRNAAMFNITKYVKKGSNVIATEVYRNSDGSFLEAQDMFRLPGIFRTVALYSTPKVQIRDLFVSPELVDQYKNGALHIEADIRNLSDKAAGSYSINYTLYANELYSDKNSKVTGVVGTSKIESITAGANQTVKTTINVTNPNKWNGETPYRYTLVAELNNSKGECIETVSVYTGFRQVEIKDTKAEDDEFNLAGRYYYINGKTVKLKGVNRHETCPEMGHTLTREQMKEEVMLMLKGNINHVRNSHYPPAPHWYYLCDKYGIYLEDEANIESHGYFYSEASLSHPPEWKNAHVGRVMEMTYQNKNHPSIVIWSLGNEAGPGKNFVHAYDALKKVDKSRPVQYERNNSIVDMGSNQYPSIGWMKHAVKGKMGIKYPFHISEYAHSMGNACGNLVDYWKAIESTNFFCGGAIWDWVDQAVYNYTEDGTKYLAYGGDFGDKPNSGQFVMNGIIFAERDLKPQYYEVKKVYQYVEIKTTDVKKGEFTILNKNYYTDLSRYTAEWSLWENGELIEDGNIKLPSVPARATKKITCDYSKLKLNANSEYFVKIQIKLKSDEPWADKGYVQAEEQFQLQTPIVKPAITSVVGDDKIELITQNSIKLITQSRIRSVVVGEDFTAKFNMEDGSLYALAYDGDVIIENGNGPKLDAYRAFVNNDTWGFSGWFNKGLHKLQHKVIGSQTRTNKDGSIVLSFTVVSQAKNDTRIQGGTSTNGVKLTDGKRKFGEQDFRFVTNQDWTVYADGSIELQSSITSNDSSFVLPRIGYSMVIPKEYKEFTYYGRGPINNYNDRETAQFIQKYETTVKEQVLNFPKPQDMGNREDVRWCALTKGWLGKAGAVFIATGDMAVSAMPYTDLDLATKGHMYELPKAGDTVLHLDAKVSGLGGASCGQGGPLGHDRAFASQRNFGFIIRPASRDLDKVANVSGVAKSPLAITRSRSGSVKVSAGQLKDTLCFTLDGGKVQEFTKPFLLRSAGTITAWYKGNKDTSSTTIKFNKIERIETIVVFTSSQENSGNASARNLTDGNPATTWHSMYSVTVAQYPHWVDFDSGDLKTIKGFTYLPRQDGGNNGDIKDYSIQTSLDGKKWSKVIVKGRFSRDKKEKRVLFNKPVKTRFVRFTATSSQNGQDFAGGAEFSLLAD